MAHTLCYMQDKLSCNYGNHEGPNVDHVILICAPCFSLQIGLWNVATYDHMRIDT